MKGKKVLYIVIGIIIVIAVISFPAIISFLVYDPCMLPCIPGKDETWLGFWASYSGTIATLLVAFLTWKNSFAMEKLQRQYYELDTSANLRLNGISITPIIKEQDCLNQYRIKIVFDNMAKCLIYDMEIRESKCESYVTITIGAEERKLNVLDYTYFMMGSQPIIQFRLEISKEDTKMRKAFAGFCYYYSQFSPEAFKMEMEMPIRIQYGEGKNNEVYIFFKVELSPTPVIERKKEFNIAENTYLADAYEILAENYSLMPA